MASSSGGMVIKLGLAGVGAYLLYQWYQSYLASQAAAAVAAPTTGATNISATTTTTTAPPAGSTQTSGGGIQSAPVTMNPPGGVKAAPVTTVTPKVTSDMLSAALRNVKPAGWNGLASADDWNWAYTQVSGTRQTADLFLAGNRAQLIDVNTYLSRRAARGLSGFGDVGPYRMVGRASKGRTVVMIPTRGPWVVPPSAFEASPSANPWKVGGAASNKTPWSILGSMLKRSAVSGVGDILGSNPRRSAVSGSGMGYFTSANFQPDWWLLRAGSVGGTMSGLSSACDPKAVTAAMGSS